MSQRAVVVAVFLLELLAMLAMAPGTAADPRVHGVGRGGGSGLHAHHAGRHQSRPHAHRAERHGAFPRHLGRFGVVTASSLVVYRPPVFAFSPPFSPVPPFPAPPPYYGAPPYTFPVVSSPLSPVAPPAPMPRVVEHPTGRYELRGDGIGTPYTWVWIPNPPPAPPPPSPSPPAGAPTSSDAPPAREQVYQWVDEQGVAHWTNRLDRIPRRYREEARR